MFVIVTTLSKLQFQHLCDWHLLEAGVVNGEDWRHISEDAKAGPSGKWICRKADSFVKWSFSTSMLVGGSIISYKWLSIYSFFFSFFPNFRMLSIFQALIRMLLKFDPSQRLTAEQALQHEWIRWDNRGGEMVTWLWQSMNDVLDLE